MAISQAVTCDGGSLREHTLPEHIGDYRLEDVVSQGGFGVVCRARHAATGAPVAIKIVKIALASNTTIVARFEREVEAVQRVRHPNVVEILDHGRLGDGRPFIVMDLIDGVSLQQHLDARGRLPGDELYTLFRQLCAAVAAAHAQAIIHRDVKASNVMIDRQGRVVLLDFGVAKLLDDEGPGLTGSRHLIGSLSCMAPEQILVRPVDDRTDVYALGVLAYRALTGQMPFNTRSVLAMQQMHLTSIPRAPSAVAPVSPAFDAVILRALAKEPNERQPTALALLDELRAAAEGSIAARSVERHALVVFVEVRVVPEALDAPSEALLSDLEEILPHAAAELAEIGLMPAMETGTSLLVAADRPSDPAEDGRLRTDAIRVSAALHAHLASRLRASDAVDVRIYVHTGALALDANGAAVGGALLALEAWLPAAAEGPPVASRAVLEGLPLSTRPVAGADGWADISGSRSR